MSSKHSSETLKAEATRLGFFACGVAKAEAVEPEVAHRLHQWIEQKRYAGMEYMARHEDMRTDPRLLMPDVKSIVSVALNYAPAQTIPENEYQLAAFAYGQDYHDVMKQKLRQLASAVFEGSQWRVFCDSAPILERYWAAKAGLGWLGRNHQLIIPGAGSMFYLGEIFVDQELPTDEPMPNRCGNCHACLDACPTKALSVEEERGKRKEI